MYPIQDVADMLGLTLDQMAMMGSLVENDFMKHATHLKEFHYRIGVLRHPMDTVVCVGKYLKEGGSQHPDDIFMAETDQTVRSAYSERLRQSVLQYNRPQIDTCFRLRGEEASAAIKALPSEESPDYPDFDLLRLLDRSGLHDAFRDGLLEPSVVQVRVLRSWSPCRRFLALGFGLGLVGTASSRRWKRAKNGKKRGRNGRDTV